MILRSFQLVDIPDHSVMPHIHVGFIDAVILTPRWHLNVRVREQKLAHTGIQCKTVHPTSGCQHKHSGAAIDHIPGRRQLMSRLQKIGLSDLGPPTLATVNSKDGSKVYPFMGCYGIGITRVMGVIVEKFNDEKGIIWPQSVAPFQVHLIGLNLEEKEVAKKAEDTYKLLQAEEIEVLFDDREGANAGEKFADSDLIGIPYRVVISKKTEDKLEVKKRSEKETEFMNLDELLTKLKKSP